MKCTLLIVLACFAMIAESHPYLGLDAAAGIGQGLGNAIANTLTLGLGTVANIGTGVIGLGVGVVNALANGVESGLGTRGLPQSTFGNVQTKETTQQGKTHNDSEEANAYSKKSHKKSKKNYHNRARHHSIVTTITRVEKSDEQDVSNNESVEESAKETGASIKQANAASKGNSSNYEGDSQEEEKN